MNWLTVLLVLAIGGLTYRGYRQGFLRELVSLSSLLLAIPVAGLIYDDFAARLDPIIGNPTVSGLCAFLGIIIAIVIAGQVGVYLLRRTAAVLNLGWVDDWAGAGFGFILGVVGCQVVLLALVVFPKPDIRDAIDDSALATALLDSGPVVLSLLPEVFESALDAFLAGAEEIEDALDGEPTPTPVSTPTPAAQG